MKLLLSKIPALIAMLLSLFSFYYYAESIIGSIYSEIWILSAIIAYLSVLFYLVDAIISFVRAFKKDDPKFNYLLALVLVGAVPMSLIFAGSGRDSFNVIWNIYYLLMFVLEVISIKKAFAAMKANKKKA